MGCFDYVTDQAQVKCWEEGLKYYRVGDVVPAVAGETTYGVILREGGWLWVEEGVLVEVVFAKRNFSPLSFRDEAVLGSPRRIWFDKWGERVTPERDLAAEHYYFNDYVVYVAQGVE